MRKGKKYKMNFFRLGRVNLAIISIIYSNYSYSDDYFDPYSVYINGKSPLQIDLSDFKSKGGQLPGRYQAALYLNGDFLDSRKINFVSVDGGLQPDLRKSDLIGWGVIDNATPDWMGYSNDKPITQISKLIPDAFINYDFDHQRIDISIPQKFIKKDVDGYVPMSKWDDGLDALILNYAYTGSNTWSDYYSGNKNNSFLNLRSGLNINGWRVRNYSTYTNNSQGQSGWNSINTYAQHDIRRLDSKFTVGDTTTPSEVFDSYSFRGLQLSSDDSMQPESLRGFAPVVRGIAQSNAQVTIEQSGNIIWQSYVPPGPFEIRDLYPTSASGDLVVTVKESNGTVRRFAQAFSSVPIMLREGRTKYSVSLGKYRSTGIATKRPNFMQGTLIYGMPWALTLYGGNILSQDYNSFALGIGKGLGDLGSVSLDGTVAKTNFDDDSKKGASFRFQYSKDVASTGTTFTLAGYRYSTSGYYDFSEANGFFGSALPIGYDSEDHNDKENKILKNQYWNWQSNHNKKNKAEINITQNITDFGSIYISSYQQEYWGVKGKETSISTGINTSISSINYTLSYSYSKTPFYGTSDRVYSLSVQIPLDKFLPSSWLNLSSSITNDNKTVSSVGLSGTALTDNNLSYNIQQGYGSNGVGTTGNASLDYKGRYGEYQSGYNYTNKTKQVTYGVMGGILAHKYGYTLSQPLGDTIALVKADNASDIRVMNNSGVYTDNQGYAVVPYVTPYRKNRLSLDTSKLPEDVDLLGDTETVIPTSGALVLADYPTLSGRKILIKLENKTIPFGAIARVNNGNRTSQGIVDNRGMVYLSGVPSTGVVSITWEGGKCMANYRATDNKKISFIAVTCD
ncbi:fimbrial biogenesis outer membrane usher protein [Rosenbergiella sp. S61]|uniref:Fimbrial biogenesis outer membrane usher protein n=1 Tax=Rosenbergiella gaditana TaxID=2726987 RepID=A0ABS5SXC3_9GAMM|nr:fimbria/pilus outer membrane usher protein [Rosenbergiella gaditana]MBT0724143.1 fimbrial biogenesis outer membrane usher protein [Rosenbergiella gaditana]